MSTILLTGGTGVLGRALRPLLTDAGHDVRVLSRRERPENEPPETWARADLRKGMGVDAAVRGAEIVVHCASGRGDEQSTRNLAEAAAAAGCDHLVYISIVGVDSIPFSYYRSKLASEHVIEQSGVPFTILRATQFHDLVVSLFDSQRVSPFLITPGFAVQPVDVQDVAVRLAELTSGAAAGRVDDLGGPDVLEGTELARLYLEANERRRIPFPLRFPGALFRSLSEGKLLAPEHRSSGRTFADYVRDRAQVRKAQ